MHLNQLGWNSFFEGHFRPYAAQGWIPARVAADFGSQYLVWTAAGETRAELTGRLRFESEGDGLRVAVGDWVVARPVDDGFALISNTLPRRTEFDT